jgi:alkylhydroperoxidase family enzyme
MASNDRAGVVINQPKEKTEREDVAKKCCSHLEISMPMVVDEIDDRVGHAYSGMPDRLYILDRDGRVVYKGGRGPFGFKSGEMEQSLMLHLIDQERAGKKESRVPLLDSDDAWKRLPVLEKGKKQPLPAWARALAGPLPRTTAAMLELDHLQRAKSPLDPQLRGRLRWLIARLHRCAYSEACAAGDLKRLGVDPATLEKLTGDLRDLPEPERLALNFVRRLTLEADRLGDAEVEAVRKHFGDKQLVAIVLLAAYANFQDRLLLTLGIRDEPAGHRPPLEVRFSRTPEGSKHVLAPERKQPEKPTELAWSRLDDAEWMTIGFGDLQKSMTKQRERPPRIAVPTWDEVLKGLPPGTPTQRPVKIKWSLVCTGYQPELALGWGNCTRNFAQDAKQDRVFEESLFWVVTRSLNCFY